MNHINLASFYRFNCKMKLEFNYDPSEIERWYPFEREIYIDIINAHIKEKKDKAQNA